jgi:hypothetical protein
LWTKICRSLCKPLSQSRLNNLGGSRKCLSSWIDGPPKAPTHDHRGTGLAWGQLHHRDQRRGLILVNFLLLLLDNPQFAEQAMLQSSPSRSMQSCGNIVVQCSQLLPLPPDAHRLCKIQLQ